MDVNLERFNSHGTYAHVERDYNIEFIASTAAVNFVREM